MEIAQDRLAGRGRPEAIRSFIGIGLPDPQRGLLGGYLDVCRAAAPELRWVTADNLHLTLRFLGQVETTQLEDLSSLLRRLPVQPFSLRLGGLGSFGRGSAVRVVWIGVAAGGKDLERLAVGVEERCLEARFPPEERAYHPHLTLARARQRRGTQVPELPLPPELDPWAVDAFRLYRSRPGAGGAVYTVLEEFGP